MSTIDPKKFLEQEFPLSLRSQFIPMLETGADLVNAVFDEHPEFYSSDMSSNIRGRLFSFAIMLQFSPDIGIFNAPGFRVECTTVNKFKYTVPQILSPNAVMHVAKVPLPTKLPGTSNYKKRYALGNSPFSAQREIDFDAEPWDNGKSPFTDPRKYVLLTYGSRNNRTIDFARLMLPDYRFRFPIEGGVINLNEEWKMYSNAAPANTTHAEKNLVKLKEEFIKHWGNIIKND